MMIVLVILAMLLFTLDSLFSDSELNLWLLGLLLGGAVFGVAGIGQGRWLQWGIGGAILGTVLGYVLPGFLAPGGISTSFGVLEDKEINDLASRRVVANQFMMQATEASFGQGMAQFAPLFGFGYDGARDVILGRLLREEARRLGITVDKSMVGDYLKRATSEKLTSEDYVAIRNNLAYQGRAITDDQLQQILADEIQARMAYQTLTTRTSTLPPGPEVYWQFYRRLNVRQQVLTAALDVNDFVDQVGDPTDAQVEELFREFSRKLPNEVEPGSPGFRLPLRAKLAYLEIDSAAIEAGLEPVSDEAVEKYYQDNKESSLIRREVTPDFPADTDKPAEDKPTDDKPAEDKSGGEEKTDEKKADEKPAEPTPADDAKPAAEAKPAEEAKSTEEAKPADDAKPAEENKSADDAEPAADDNILESEEDDFDDDEPESAETNTEAKDESVKKEEPSQASVEDKPSEDKPGEDKPSAAPSESEARPETAPAEAGDKADKPADTSTSLTIPDAPAGSATADSKPEVKYEYRPLDDEMKKLIRDEIQQQKVREIVQEKMQGARVQMESLASERNSARFAELEKSPESFSADNEGQQDAFKALRLSLQSLQEDLAARLKKHAADNGMAYVETPLLTFAELLDSEDFAIGTATEPVDNPMFAPQSPSVAETVFRSFGEEEQGNDAQLFFVREAQRLKRNGEGQSHFLYWATDFDLSHVPTLSEPGVRDMVVKTWKQLQAREIIKKRGEELADLVRDGLKKEGEDHKDMAGSLAEATVTGKEGSSALAVRRSLPFSWLRTSAAAPMSFQQPQVQMGQIQFDDAAGGTLDRIGSDFMEAIFEGLGNDEVGVIPNFDHSIYYVVQTTNRFPTPEVGEDSLREKFATEAQFGFRQSPLLSVMQQEIARPANIEWETALWKKYGIDLNKDDES
ncbi:MAG: hypothetical protein R3C49_04225 [Planctomycetaceae bacterium]